MNIFVQYSKSRYEHLAFIELLNECTNKKHYYKTKFPYIFLCDHTEMSLQKLIKEQEMESTVEVFKKLDKILEYSDIAINKLKKTDLFIMLLPTGLSGFIHLGYAIGKMKTMIICGKELYGDVVCIHNIADYVVTDQDLALSIIEEIIEQD